MSFLSARWSSVRPTDWRFIVGGLAASRAALMLVGLIAPLVLHEPNRHLELIPSFGALEMWAQWDAAHYVDVAAHGYSYVPGQYSNVPFFPLYPWLIRLLGLPFGPLSEEAAALLGLLVANVALFVGLLYLANLVARDLSLSVARRTVVYVLVFPTTVFLSSVYAESLFLATAAASLYHARKGEWYRAGLAGGLAALTRPYGFLLLVPMAIEMFHQRAPTRVWPSIALVPAGLAVYLGYLWLQFGDPLLYFKANQVWGRGFHWPWETLLAYLGGPLVGFDWPYSWLDLLSMIAMVTILAVAWRRVPLSYAAYTAVGLLFALSTGVAWFSASRHALALFPVIIMLAVLGERRGIGWPWLILSTILSIGFMARVAVGYWVA